MKYSAWCFAAVSALLAVGGCAILSGDPPHPAGLRVRDGMLDRNSCNLTYKYGKPMPKVEYITIHNTWNFGPAANERDYLNQRRDNQYISFHYAVDETEAIQILPLDVSGWHAGDGGGKGNSASIGVEICRSRCIGRDEPLYREAEENAVKLAAWLLVRHGLPLSALRKHQDWSGKYCPHRILDEGRWESFRQRVGTEMSRQQ